MVHHCLGDTVISVPDFGRSVAFSSISKDWFMSKLKLKFWKNLHIRTLASICQYVYITKTKHQTRLTASIGARGIEFLRDEQAGHRVLSRRSINGPKMKTKKFNAHESVAVT
jgi:hypothetical protein